MQDQHAGGAPAALGARARDFVKARYSWTEIVPRLERLYAE
ncbi:MAG: hypothetical protein R2932_00240 [Caldilineaceae bacterium]